jgi:PAS domain S-box-containing protein/putative nucleotidyltransferase with HDIG domain
MKDKPVILIVDDRPQNIKLLEAQLAPQGYEIVKAANGEEALEKLSGNQIDLILLDVKMPGMDGFEVTRRVRQDNAHRLLPIILVTVLRDTEDRVKGIEAGCDDFLSMPLDKMELLARVRSLLKVKAYNDLMSNYRKELESEVTSRTEELKHALENLQQDITDRKRSEEALKESEKKYRLLADNVNDVIFVLDMNLNYTYVSPSVKILRGYEPEELLNQPSIETLTPSSRDLAMRTLSEVIELEKSEHRDIPISRTLQLEMRRKDGTTVWTEVKFSSIKDDNQRPVGILGVTRDITYRKRAEEELQRTLESLRESFGATIQVMVSAIELRDPYTAGHQLRSANLACAIATEIGLTQEKINGIRMAGFIHDIGKISIPAEILSKPTKLTNIEFSLIKEHSKQGYEMLKDVESPWPLAEMVYQHHERMNGSGYPRNLKGEEICTEARILAVADVVEAMASHRPYRPGLGIDLALAEIEKNRGTLYDEAVADACLRLFREKGHHLI